MRQKQNLDQEMMIILREIMYYDGKMRCFLLFIFHK